MRKATTGKARSVFARSDWPLIGGASVAVALVVSTWLIAPNWSNPILGVVAVAFVVLLGVERARARRRVQRLATQLKSSASLEKLEVGDDPANAALAEALNAAIQRTREHAHLAQQLQQPGLGDAAAQLMREIEGAPRSIAVLALGVREQDHPLLASDRMAQLRHIASTVVAVAERHAALIQMQGSGTFALIFAAFAHEPVGRSAKVAYDAALELMAAHPSLHLGLSAGTGLPCQLPGAGYTVIGTPLEEALRLHRLALSWDEYRLLCPEPVALLLLPRINGQRTTLQLTAAHAPPLPVYALDTAPDRLALGA